MAKITLNNIESGFQSNAQQNANLDLIETTINDRVLFRDSPAGEPNQMLNLLDMNDNPIINVGRSNQANAVLTRQDLADLADLVALSPVLAAIGQRQIFTSNGVDVTPDISYAYGYVRFIGATAASFIVPEELSVSYLRGTEIHIRQAGTGAVEIVPNPGVTVNPPASGTLFLGGQGATVTIKKITDNEWDLMGQVFASS